MAKKNMTDEEKEKENLARIQRKNEEKILKRILQVMAAAGLIFVFIIIFLNAVGKFTYKNLEFKIVREGDLIFYQTSVPVIYKGQGTDYNFYLRNDPRKLENKVPVIGEIVFRKNIVFNVTTENLSCNGYWEVALGNLYSLYDLMNLKILRGDNGTDYPSNDNYMFVTFNEANVTEIRKQTGNSYDLNVNNCEVLAVAERLMIETLIQFKEKNS